ncbi:MAG: chemotaxis protein CheA [Gammaproteobacteria bacterium]|nr:MAG: chemotaxis protein CheA [Gammaproteobacteria bacterium]
MEDDNEILQDFLVEAGEILDKLGEQLVELEARPGDSDLLNAVFRGFHTVKGGAGFLNITPLVEVCHRAEDVFNVLRQGARKVDAELMDVMLRVLDIVNAMMDAVRAGRDPEHADAALLAQLDGLAKPDAPPGHGKATSAGTEQGEANDTVYQQLLDTLAPPASEANATAGADKPGAASPPKGDEITDSEFEALLDQLQSIPKSAEPQQDKTQPAKADEISDAEFDALLDELHGPAGRKITPPGPAAAREKPKGAAPAPVKAETQEQATAETSVRVDTKRLDDIMNMVGELVLSRNRLVRLQSGLNNEEVAQAVATLDLVTSDLQTAVMKTRMQPIKKVFGRFPRVVRDISRSMKKEVTLELQGEDTDLDKNLVEALADPLVHLVRNAVDHGVETPEARTAAGKARAGTVILAAEQEGDHILLTIADDGAGMDAEVLRRKVVEKGLMDAEAAARLTQRDCYNLIFLPGFSTKSEITDISGRGVGMDVVKTRIAQLNGTVEIESQKGKGTRFMIKVPLTLAIIPTLMVMVGARIFALPLMNVHEIFDLDLSRTNTIDGQPTIMVRDHALPLYYLNPWLLHDAPASKTGGCRHVVMVNYGIQRVGFVVDQLLGQEEVVIKPLGAALHGTPGLAGATITGDGRIALILDVPGLMKAYARKAA